MFQKILIANRGEIALRVIWACRELGIRTVAVWSEADRDSLHVRFADEDVCIGPAKATESYLHIPNVISAAEITGSDAIHPGYGFLAENPHFAEVCDACSIRFIGPTEEVMRLMGDKVLARQTVAKADVPVVPGSAGAVADANEAHSVANDIGFPVLLKAVAGGGGKGMRVVRNEENLASSYAMASAEAHAAFGDGRIYIEKFLREARHIEFQLLGDDAGSVIHLFERECSVQRRHQKLVEESPSTAIDDEKREIMAHHAVEAARQVGYTGAGTVEFLLTPEGNHYFIEMNTRIQVEHPVTEMITGIDLVKEQIRIAAGEKLRFRQEDVSLRGHAIECRVNAEDPDTFAPSPGTIVSLNLPGGPGIRIETAAHQGYAVSPYYDSLIGKVIACGRDRHEAMRRMDRALSTFVCEGIQTTIPLLSKIISHPDFEQGNLSTAFLSRILPS